MGLKRLSPSAISTFKDLCERRWYYAKVLKIPEPPNPRAESGTRMHAILEAWLKDGTPPAGETTEDEMALASIPSLPAPQFRDNLIVEKHIEFGFGKCKTCDGFGFLDDDDQTDCEDCNATGHAVLYHGYPDVRWYTEGYAVVHDHKSTSDLRWAKSEEDLQFDPQRIIYGYAASGMTWSAMGPVYDVLSRWQYVQTRKLRGEHPKKLVEVFSTGNQVVNAMSWLHEAVGVRMVEAYDKAEDDIPQNPNACGKFGKQGCPYKYRCNIDPGKQLKQIMTLDAIRKRMHAQAKQMETSEDKPPEEDPVEVPEEVQEEVNKAEDKPTPAPAKEAPAEAKEEAKEEPERTKTKVRKPRADKGKPRGPRKKKDGEDPYAANREASPKEVREAQVEMIDQGRRNIEVQKINTVMATMAAEERALLDVIQALKPLDMGDRARIIKAAAIMLDAD